MKKVIFSMLLFALTLTVSYAQQPDKILEASISKLDNAKTVEDYEQLAESFLQVADERQTQWLPYYYAAFCNAKIGWLNFDDPDKIEPYADKADEAIQRARKLLDSAVQQKEMSEVYVVLSMINRARVYINVETYGRRYGIPAGQYTQMARKANPDNPRALYIEGWEKYATPKLWGGDKNKAKELLTKAKKVLSGQSSAGTAPRWGMQEVDELLSKLK
ncbi:MAG: hypothetical protein JNK79_00185 [Chitinophagaceae bacterium]|nr:hypothetical protein [Chitinophagaceae bacterium]